MAYISKGKAITVNGQTWLVNSSKSGLFTKQLTMMIAQIENMLSYHSKVLVIRFDLRLYEYMPNNKLITIFNRRLFKWLTRKYGVSRIGFAWCRERETAKQQHYHYVLLLDGHKVRHPHEILLRIKEVWETQLDGSMYTPENCYYNIQRDDRQSIQDAIWRVSYLAKGRGKGYRDKQAKDYGTSRIKKRDN